MIIDRLWAYVPSSCGNTNPTPTDLKKIADNGYVKFQVNRKDVAEGPMIMFPSGYGVYGSTTENAAGIVSNGVPSVAAAPKLKREQYITSDHDLDAVLKFYDCTT